jgi:hypothetical protein
MVDVALGFRAHSGWAAMVAVAAAGDALTVVARQRVALVDPAAAWAMQPYHAAEELPAEAAAKLVRSGIAMAWRRARQQVGAAVKQLGKQGHDVVACGVVLGSAMPAWSVAEILAVHLRMHQAEGVLFRDALVAAGEAAGLPVTGVRERELWQQAAPTLRLSSASLQQRIAAAGKVAGPPWARDQKDAALVAWLALVAPRRRH